MSFIADIAKRLRIRIHRHLFDFGYDTRRSIDTTGVVFPEQLDLAGDNAAHAVQYEPTPATLFRYLLKRLASQVDFSQLVFVDIGSVKGRILMLAAGHPFLRVEGVELSGRLHQIASHNLQQGHAAPRARAPIVLRNEDATKYRFPNEPLLVYLFNPFDAPVLEQVLRNLRHSLDENPRDCIVLYVNSKHKELFDEENSLQELPSTRTQALVEAILSPWPIAVYRFRDAPNL